MVPFPDPFENRNQVDILTVRDCPEQWSHHRQRSQGYPYWQWQSSNQACSYHSHRWLQRHRRLWPPIAASIESAMISRDVREKRIPGVPIAIPSATVMVPNWTDQAPASFTPSLANFPKSWRWMLQGYFPPMSKSLRQSVSKAFIGHSRRAKHGTVGEILPCYRRHYYDGVCLILSCHSSRSIFYHYSIK